MEPLGFVSGEKVGGMRASIWAAGLVLLGLGPASGEGLRALVTADDTKGWEAVGRLDIGLDGFCTGALIAPDVVLTAAHCLFDPETRARIGEDEIQFLAGFRNGRATAYRSVRRAVIHPDYVYTGPEGADHVHVDVALIALDRPVRNTSVVPFETAARPRKGDAVQVVSYAHDRASRPSIEDACHILGRPAGTLVMSCDVDFGSSGAPVFAVSDGVARIVSVVSAKAEIDGRRVSLGTRLDGILPELEAALDNPAPQTGTATASMPEPVRAEGPGSAGGRLGAKFLRP